jgi:hypothetical protein
VGRVASCIVLVGAGDNRIYKCENALFGMEIGVFGKKGLVGLQVWLMIFGFVGMIGIVSAVSEDTCLELGGIWENEVCFMDGNEPATASGEDDLIGDSTSGITDSDAWKSDSYDIGASILTTFVNTDNSAGVDAGDGGKDIKIGEAGLSKLLELKAGGGADSLAMGAQWAVVAYGVGKMAGGILGMDSDNTEALSTALAAGAGVYQAISTYASGAGEGMLGAEGAIGGNAGLIGAGVAAAVFVVMYKKADTKLVEFSCMPWQAPNGGDSCQVCNEDDLPCSEYRCKSLGQSCEIVNAGTEEEKCVYVNPRDVSPPVISPDSDELSIGYEYTNVKSSPPGPGFDIVNSNSRDGCLKAFTPLTFGISTGDKDTGEPSQCKIDFNHTTSYEDMVAYVGGNNLYSYDHSETFSLPGAKNLSENGFVLENGKDMTFYLRCRDKNGNTNEAEYAVNFCIDPTPDTTAPKIEATSIINGGCVAENTDSADVVFYTNEPSSCRWSFQDQDYDLMTESMACSDRVVQINAVPVFGCTASLTGIPRDGTSYYVRCKDKASSANEMRESFEFGLRGSNGLALRNLKPNGTVLGGVSPAPIELYVETLFGCNEGRAVCKWSNSGTNWIDFFDTNTDDRIHTQRLDLTDGDHNYYVRCIDEGGNVAEDVARFDVDIDTSAPVVARVYEESGMLKIVTVRDSECSYSLDNCDFSFSEGVEMPNAGTPVHVAEWSEGNTYHVKCRDEFLNEGAACSVVVRPTENFL